MNATLERPIDRWFENYSADHRNDTNQAIHVIAVPAILWSVVALIWCIPVFGTLFQNGIWAGLAMFAAWMFYNRLSRSIGYGMLVAFFTIGCSCRLIEHSYGIKTLRYAAISVFGVAWIAQFVGHKIEGKKPSFFEDLQYLWVGPLFVLSKLFVKLGVRW